MTDASRLRRLPLRDLLNHVDHKCRELIEHLHMDVTPTVAEFHKLTRPTRKKSAYPSLRIICNVHERLKRSNEYSAKLIAQLDEGVQMVEERMQSGKE